MKEILSFILNNNLVSLVIGSLLTLVTTLILKKQENKLDKDKDTHKGIIDNKNYISKVRFDAEFKIYQELSEKNINLVYCVSEAALFCMAGLNDDKELCKKLNDMCDLLNEAEKTTRKYAPFIDKKLFEKYKELQTISVDIFKLFGFWYNNKEDNRNFNYKNIVYKIEDIPNALKEMQIEMSNLSNTILDDVREYLQQLDVL